MMNVTNNKNITVKNENKIFAKTLKQIAVEHLVQTVFVSQTIPTKFHNNSNILKEMLKYIKCSIYFLGLSCVIVPRELTITIIS